ncbi:type IV secretory system conjugative DNA transfer family protein [Bacillus sp. FJAT-29937]|uniref:type IV secretory system conjugative DNA transfer family protein n=1 Tax=Bacillus sp. FJAT-29937 TaxID=1720553 RepID=UPI000830A4EA|nr:TraM recognition domain-containing protein [Bacillus sp. FJAT-29937]
MQLTRKVKTFWLKNSDKIEEYIRLKFHTYFVTALTSLNVIIGLGGLGTWLKLGFGIPLFAIFEKVSWTTFQIFLLIPLITWFYSTITKPIKKGFKIVLDWSFTERGRLLSLFINVSSLTIMLWAAAARYIAEHYDPFISKIEVDPKQYNNLLVTNLDAFLTLIYFSPVILTGILLVITYRHYKINEDITKEQFFKWEFGPIARFSHDLLYDKFDVIVGWDKKTKKPLVLKEKARYLHELVDGATGSGKTSTALFLRIAQDLTKIARGIPGGLVLLEPKGDAVDDVLKLAKELGVPDEKIMVVDPTKAQTTKFNPFFGQLEAAAESFRGTLNSLTGDQDEFFKGQQEETAALYTMLAKLAYKDFTNITHIQKMYTDPRFLATVTERVRASIETARGNPDIEQRLIERWERIVSYFEDEVLDYKTYRDKDQINPVLYPDGHRYAGQQVVESKKDKYVSGAKKYLNDIAMNSMLSDLMISKDGDKVLNLDEFLENGGVLLINTALGELEELSLLLGQFFIRQFQSAVFRRPKDGEEIGEGENKRIYKRIPIFFNIDEFPLYINEAFERMLTLGRSYNVGSLIAIQSLGQLDSVVKGYRETIMTNASNKTVFGRGAVEDNQIFSETFLEEIIIEESLNESTTPVTVENQSWGYRHNTQKITQPKFSPTDIAKLPFKHMIVQLVKEDGSIDEARLATGSFVTEARFLKKYFKQLELKSEQTDDLIVIDNYLEQMEVTAPNMGDDALSDEPNILNTNEPSTLNQENPDGTSKSSNLWEILNNDGADDWNIDAFNQLELDLPGYEEDSTNEETNDKPAKPKKAKKTEDAEPPLEQLSIDSSEIYIENEPSSLLEQEPAEQPNPLLPDPIIEDNEEKGEEQGNVDNVDIVTENDSSASPFSTHSIHDKEQEKAVEQLLQEIKDQQEDLSGFQKENEEPPKEDEQPSIRENPRGVNLNLDHVEDDL